MSISTNAPDRPLRVERRGTALVLTICRAQAGNSIDLETAEAMNDAIAGIRGDPSVRAVVITGSGGKFFCTGGDIKAYRAITTPEELERVFGYTRSLLDALEELPVLALAAIDGYALGGGLELALACDLRFASAAAKLGMPQSKLGIIPGWNGIERLTATVGRSQALRLASTGEPVSAAEAFALGLVDEVAESGGALAAALAFADRLNAAAPLSLQAVKAVGLALRRDTREAARELARRSFERLWFSADHREAEAAFADKRIPRFEGR